MQFLIILNTMANNLIHSILTSTNTQVRVGIVIDRELCKRFGFDKIIILYKQKLKAVQVIENFSGVLTS